MTIAKRHIAVEELLGTYLSFTPRAVDTDLFRADMRILNPVLLSDSIKECHSASKKSHCKGMAQRAEIHRVYTRKTKELASLYPFVFSVENALRHTTAEFFGQQFGTDKWWVIIRDAVASGHDEAHFLVNADGMKNIRGVPVTPKFVRQLFYCFKNLSATQNHTIQGADVIDEIYLCLSLGGLLNLIEADWVLSRQMFVSDAELGGVLRKNDMTSSFNILKVARNELFHSKGSDAGGGRIVS